jgi:hypothetical protein
MPDQRQRESGVRVVSSLREAFRKAGWKVENQSRLRSPRCEPDLVISKGDLCFVVELKVLPDVRRDRLVPVFALAALQGRKQAQQVQEQVPQLGKVRPLVMLALPRVPESLVSHLRELAIDLVPDVDFGAVGVDGSRYFSHPALSSLNARGEPKPSVVPVAAASVNWFSDLNQWMLKVLLAPQIPEPLLAAPRGHYRNVSELAKAAHVSVMSAFRLARQLEAENFLEADAGRLRLVRVAELMDRWQAAHQLTRREYPAHWILGAGSPDRLPAAVRDYLRDADQQRKKKASLDRPRVCLGLFAAAEQLELGFVHGAIPHLYVQSPDQGDVRRLGLAIGRSGKPADVMVRFAPKTGSVFRGAVQAAGVPAADVLQVWLDVQNHPARGRQQADEIRRRVLRPLFVEKA